MAWLIFALFAWQLNITAQIITILVRCLHSAVFWELYRKMHSGGSSKYLVLHFQFMYLTKYSIFTFTDIPEISQVLYQRQYRLTNYQYHPHGFRMPRNLQLPLNADMLAHITSVRLHLAFEDDCRATAKIVAHTPGITELTIEFGATWKVRDTEACRNFLNILCLEDTTRRFPRLRSLCLKDFALTLLGPVLSQSISLSELRELRLVRCRDAGRMLLSLELQQMAWKTLHIEEERCRDNGELRSLLKRMNAPKVLSIGLDRGCAEACGGGKLCWTDLLLHSSTLTSLRLNIEQPGVGAFDDRYGKSVADFREFCKSATNLKQLALTSPHIEEEKWQGENGFSVFLVRIELLCASGRSSNPLIRNV
jgi:hypothetical protein